jgi:hypothetical protein
MIIRHFILAKHINKQDYNLRKYMCQIQKNKQHIHLYNISLAFIKVII